MIPDPCLMNLQEIDYAVLKSGESIEVETICPKQNPYSWLQMLLLGFFCGLVGLFVFIIVSQMAELLSTV